MLAAKKVTSKQVTQFDYKGKKIKTYPSTMEAFHQTGIPPGQISHAATGFKPTAHGFFRSYGNDRRFDVKNFLAKRRTGYKEKRGSKVTQYNFNGEPVACYLTLSDAANAVGAKSYISISAVIKGKASSALGYYWKKGWSKKKIDLNGYKYGYGSGSVKQSKKVKQYSLQGTPLRTFNSLREAAEKVGVHRSAISYALKLKNRTAAGFKWRYADKK